MAVGRRGSGRPSGAGAGQHGDGEHGDRRPTVGDGASRGRTRVIRARIASPHRPHGRPYTLARDRWPVASSATPSSQAIRARAARAPAADRPGRSRVVSLRRDGLPAMPGLPGAVALPTETAQVAELRAPVRPNSDVPDRPARRRIGAVRRRDRHRRRPDDRLHGDGPDPRDRHARTCAPSSSPGSSTPGSRPRSPSRACSTRRTRRATRCARSAGTSARTPAACAA